ncbi:MAG: SHOCT domain-containing protein [Oscillospiraceae bacterium]|nr:SHOCT domain-containing protein [Oscillospiraceae bacterium]
MARLYIMRKRTMAGIASPMNCYIDNKLVCKVKNGGEVTYQAEGHIVMFQCNLPNATMSDPVYLDLSAKNLITIEITPTAYKPQVKVYDLDAVVSSTVGSAQASARKFSPTKIIGNYLAVDENNRQWAIGKGVFSPFEKAIPYSYEDLVDFELLEDGSSITKGGLGRAVVGGMLFGHTGAVVGSITGKKKTKQTCTNLEIKITVNNADNHTHYIRLISSSTQRESHTYKTEFRTAQDILALLQLICHQRDTGKENAPQSPQQPASSVDELRKYKQLWDDGIISEEEFQAKKKQLLGL